MKRLLLFIALLCSTPSWATFSVVQTAVNTGCGVSGSCTVTVASTGAGHVIVVALADNANQTISSVTGGGTFTLCGAPCQAGSAATGWVDMAYTLSSTSGTTSIVINHTAGSNSSVGMVWELSSTGSPVFDTSGANLQTCTTSCTGVGLTLTGSNDLILTAASCGGTCSAISGSYAADPASPWPGGDGMAHLMNTVTGTAPTWTQTASTALVSAAIAIKDSAGAATKAAPPRVM